ncbi:MAG: signal peptidase II [Thermoleophilia bacterium]|nr:signal peptidase II [Thermoleophilia bacterium]
MRRAPLRLLLLILFLLALDQLSKYLVRARLDPHNLISILPFFRLEHVQNSGIAFGMMDGHSALILAVGSVIVLLLVGAALATSDNPSLAWPMALLVAGSAGNLIDRAVNGSVTDFLHFQFWPAFNLADSYIVIGVVLLAYRLLTGTHDIGVLGSGVSGRGEQEDKDADGRDPGTGARDGGAPV